MPYRYSGPPERRNAYNAEERVETEDKGSATSEFEGYEKTKEQLFKTMSEDLRKEYIDKVPLIGGGRIDISEKPE